MNRSSDFWLDVVSTIIAVGALTLFYRGCPPNDCTTAVSECAATDGLLCDDVAKFCTKGEP